MAKKKNTPQNGKRKIGRAADEKFHKGLTEESETYRGLDKRQRSTVRKRGWEKLLGEPQRDVDEKDRSLRIYRLLIDVTGALRKLETMKKKPLPLARELEDGLLRLYEAAGPLQRTLEKYERRVRFVIAHDALPDASDEALPILATALGVPLQGLKLGVKKSSTAKGVDGKVNRALFAYGQACSPKRHWRTMHQDDAPENNEHVFFAREALERLKAAASCR